MKRKAYILVFDRDDDINYKEFHENLTSLPEVISWWHYIKSSYILTSNLSSATEILHLIEPLFPENKTLFIVEINIKNRNGKLITRAWDWLKRQDLKFIKS